MDESKKALVPKSVEEDAKALSGSVEGGVGISLEASEGGVAGSLKNSIRRRSEAVRRREAPVRPASGSTPRRRTLMVSPGPRGSGDTLKRKREVGCQRLGYCSIQPYPGNGRNTH